MTLTDDTRTRQERKRLSTTNEKEEEEEERRATMYPREDKRRLVVRGSWVMWTTIANQRRSNGRVVDRAVGRVLEVPETMESGEKWR